MGQFICETLNTPAQGEIGQRRAELLVEVAADQAVPSQTPDDILCSPAQGDPFDPRTWPDDLPYLPIWLEPENNLFAVVDRKNHAWVQQWTWRVHWDRHKRKPYATRSTYLGGRHGIRVTLFLHKEILLLNKKRPPSRDHIIGDHKSGNSLDCRIENLRWATRSQNRRNLYGIYYQQRRMAFSN